MFAGPPWWQVFRTWYLGDMLGMAVLAPLLAESKEVRDAVLASGMEHGAAETYDRLAALLGASTESAAVSTDLK
jgi:hypothetical protein